MALITNAGWRQFQVTLNQAHLSVVLFKAAQPCELTNFQISGGISATSSSINLLEQHLIICRVKEGNVLPTFTQPTPGGVVANVGTGGTDANTMFVFVGHLRYLTGVNGNILHLPCDWNDVEKRTIRLGANDTVQIAAANATSANFQAAVAVGFDVVLA